MNEEEFKKELEKKKEKIKEVTAKLNVGSMQGLLMITKYLVPLLDAEWSQEQVFDFLE